MECLDLTLRLELIEFNPCSPGSTQVTTEDPATELKRIHDKSLAILAHHWLHSLSNNEMLIVTNLLLSEDPGAIGIKKFLVEFMSKGYITERTDDMVMAFGVIDFSGTDDILISQPKRYF